MKTYTVWIGYDTGLGTTYVTSVEATCVEAAMDAALAECAEAWHIAPEDEDEIVVRGVAEGVVSILYWHDLAE